ncbi:MAG: PDZ domain-containing protein, partial [Bacteroidota bacterium]
HALADAPSVFAPEIKQSSFQIDQTTFFIHFHGQFLGGESVEAEAKKVIQKICAAQKAVFGAFPFEEYHFIYRLLPYQMRHAVEHSNSASFALPSTITSAPKRILGGLGGITSHEFWHVWNVKRIRPAAMVPYDYSQAQYTRLHWFTEGVTDYYANLMLVRAGLRDQDFLFNQLSNTITRLENSFAATVISPSSSSFNSWLGDSPYRHPDHQISYYTLGTRVGLLIDLKLRGMSDKSLDDVFRKMYQQWQTDGRGLAENEVQKVLEDISGESWQDFFDRYVHGTESADYDALLKAFGLEMKVEEKEMDGLQKLGVLRTQEHSRGLIVERIHPGGDAFAGGLGKDDLIMEVDGQGVANLDLTEYFAKLKKGDRIRIKVISEFDVREVDIRYEGKYVSRTFSIQPRKKIKDKQRAELDSWLKG